MLELRRTGLPEMEVATTPAIENLESDTEAKTAMNAGVARLGRRHHGVEDQHIVIGTVKGTVRLRTAVAMGATVAVAVEARAVVVRHTTATKAKRLCWMVCQ